MAASKALLSSARDAILARETRYFLRRRYPYHIPTFDRAPGYHGKEESRFVSPGIGGAVIGRSRDRHGRRINLPPRSRDGDNDPHGGTDSVDRANLSRRVELWPRRRVVLFSCITRDKFAISFHRFSSLFDVDVWDLTCAPERIYSSLSPFVTHASFLSAGGRRVSGCLSLLHV